MSKNRIELDADIAALTMPEARIALKGYGPANRIENPRIRKVVREARMFREDLPSIKVALQTAREFAFLAAKRSS